MLPRRYCDISKDAFKAMHQYEQRTHAELLAEAQRSAYVNYLNAHYELVEDLVQRAQVNRHSWEELL